jgi:hypothetical protein
VGAARIGLLEKEYSLEAFEESAEMEYFRIWTRIRKIQVYLLVLIYSMQQSSNSSTTSSH